MITEISMTSKDIADSVKYKLENEGTHSKRYKFVVNVMLGNNQGQGI